MAGMSATAPCRCDTTIAFVCPVMAASMCAAVGASVAGLVSTRTGVACSMSTVRKLAG